MRSPFFPFLLAAVVTLLIGVGVRMEPYFAGDVRAARALQQAVPQPASWATPVSRLAPAPAKYYVMAVALVASFFVAGWRGLAIVVCFLLLEQYGAESSKALFKRPRPSRDVIAVVGNPSGYSFPSTTITFYAVTIGAVGMLALVRKKAPYRWPVVVLSFAFLLVGCAARVALGAHWPSDVLLTSLLCLVWIWAASRGVLSRG
jgi:membrane-associated phospholipid phosphatase